ncbi:LANO_0D06678g1_1 [Lachancea nothofagi CBS 11611]|uniref:LANO_0D06678g1_1 n=1 Tax=Lachancea nothofagi CBS 11611 TaxID=1266666 RepID=A0A1G4JHI4_9SACH|nr:LANO_0D06678g1_1 [Lachancea nothofagi CBS 11611]
METDCSVDRVINDILESLKISSVESSDSDTPKNPSLKYCDIIQLQCPCRGIFLEKYEEVLTEIRVLGAWNEKEPILASLVNEEAIIELDFEFYEDPEKIHRCRLLEKGVKKYLENKRLQEINAPAELGVLTCLSLALQLDWEIEILRNTCIMPAKEKYIRAPPHCFNGEVVLLFRPWKTKDAFGGLGRNLYQKIKKCLLDHFCLSEVEKWPDVYTRRVANETMIVILLEGELVIMSHDKGWNRYVLESLQAFSMVLKEISGPQTQSRASVLLQIAGMEIEYVKGTLMNIRIETKIKEIYSKLKCFSLYQKFGSHSTPVPGIGNHDEYQESSGKTAPPEEVLRLQELIRFFIIASNTCRFEISFYVDYLLKNFDKPTRDIIGKAGDLMQYLWSTKHRCLCWEKSNVAGPIQLDAFADASSFVKKDWSDVTLGYYFKINSNAMGGVSEKVTSTEWTIEKLEIFAIYRSLTRLNDVNVFLRHLGYDNVTSITSDSKSALNIVKFTDFAVHDKFYEEILVRIKELDRKLNLRYKFIRSKENFADLLTKPLKSGHFESLVCDYFSSHR